MTPRVLLLAGGTGGAKLACGLQDVVGENLTVIANTGDDIEIYGAYVSPDPDLITFWLADRIDERGWGIKGDTFHAMEMLRELGEEPWFSLGDKDLALCLWRAGELSRGERMTVVANGARVRFGVKADVLPMCDEPVRTWVETDQGWHSFQEFMIKRPSAQVQGVEFRGVDSAAVTPEIEHAINGADVIIIGPSNPVISINPILSVPKMTELLINADAPKVAVSPLVHGKVLKGPTSLFMAAENLPLNADGIATYYQDLIDGLVTDEDTALTTTLKLDVNLGSPEERHRVAQATLQFADQLGRDSITGDEDSSHRSDQTLLPRQTKAE